MGYPITEAEIKHDNKEDKLLEIATEIKNEIHNRTGEEPELESIMEDLEGYDNESIEHLKDYDSLLVSWAETSKFTGIDCYTSEVLDIETVYQNGEEIGTLKPNMFSGKMQLRLNENTSGLELGTKILTLVSERLTEYNADDDDASEETEVVQLVA